MPKFQTINGKRLAFVKCPDCKKIHPVSHKNYYTQKSFRCIGCARIHYGKTKGKRLNKKWKTSHGYIKVFVGKDHPLSDCRGETYEHRLIMSQILGRPLTRFEHVHHKNGKKADNRPKNLELIPNGANHNLITKLQTRINHLESILTKHNIKF